MYIKYQKFENGEYTGHHYLFIEIDVYIWLCGYFQWTFLIIEKCLPFMFYVRFNTYIFNKMALGNKRTTVQSTKGQVHFLSVEYLQIWLNPLGFTKSTTVSDSICFIFTRLTYLYTYFRPMLCCWQFNIIFISTRRINFKTHKRQFRFYERKVFFIIAKNDLSQRRLFSCQYV